MINETETFGDKVKTKLKAVGDFFATDWIDYATDKVALKLYERDRKAKWLQNKNIAFKKGFRTIEEVDKRLDEIVRENT